MTLLVSCEHGGNRIPAAYRALFHGAGELLNSHRGWDAGALDLMDHLRPIANMEFHSETSRLLVELNRSIKHPRLLSERSKALNALERSRLLKERYHPYRDQLIAWVAQHEGRVFHVSVHSFTPVLNGKVRNADIGLLYDPGHGVEKAWAKSWKQHLIAERPTMRVRMNYPYRGIDDGLTKALRARFGERYAGIELEVNQGLLVRGVFPTAIKDLIRDSLASSLEDMEQS